MRSLQVARVCICAVLLVALGAARSSRADSIVPGSVAGIVRTPGGVAVGGVTIEAEGPVRAETASDPTGAFTLQLQPGTYAVTALKAGYTTVSTPGIVVIAGQQTMLNVTLAEPSLNTLRTIGSVSTTGHGSATINTSAAAVSYTPGDQFTQLADPQINDVLQQTSDVTIEKLGTQADQDIVVGGLQPYETQVLIDGHPLALGQYGVWLTQYFPSYLIGGVETQSGPGNTTPFANVAVGGTVNLQSIPFTKKTTFSLTQGVDNYSSQYTNAFLTTSTGKLDLVVGAGTAGENGYYFGKRECDVYTGYGAPNTPQSSGLVAFCGNFSGSLYTQGQVYKARYNVTPTTSLEFGFIGSYGGYSPQGSAWGASYGPTKVLGCLPTLLECTNPNDANLIGKTINGFYWYPGTILANSQQLYDFTARTAFGDTTLLVRPYIAQLQPETYLGNGEGQYPAFFAPPAGSTYVYPNAAGTPVPQPVQPPSLGAGVPIPKSGLPNANYFESVTCPVGTIYSYSQINSPGNTIRSVGGQEECFQYPYSTYEQDKLYGTTVSLVKPIERGNGFLDLTYDFHGQSTFAFANAPQNFQVSAGSGTRYSTFSFTGKLEPFSKLAVDFGLYNTLWRAIGQQPLFADGMLAGETGLDRTVDRTDPHLALTYRLDGDTSLRAAAGTSETFPFIGDVSGPAASQPAADIYSGGLVTEKNPNLKPEDSVAYELGADHRFRNGAVASLDLQDAIVHDVFQQLTTTQTAVQNGKSVLVGIFTPINVARLEARLVTLKYKRAPLRGFGWNLSVTADSSIFSGIPASAYNSASATLPANGVQACGNGGFTPGLSTCIPYLKGYAEFNFTLNNGTFVALGTDYEGKNNAYYQPPMAILDLRYREPLTRTLDLNLSVQNLLNTNAFDYLPAPGIGQPAVADILTPSGKIAQTTFPTYRLPAPTRTLRASVTYHVGR